MLETNVIASLREIMGDEFTLLIHTYINDAESRLGEMAARSAAQDIEWMTRAFHSLTGSSLNLGLHEFAALCQSMENTIKAWLSPLTAAQLNELRSHVDKLRTEFAIIKQTLQHFV